MDELHVACEKGHFQLVRALLDSGTSVNLRAELDGPRYGASPLHMACMRGRVKIVKELLDRGADIEAADEHGETPLHKACVYKGHVKVISELLDRGASIEARSTANFTPLITAVAKGRTSCCSTIVRLLLSKGASINATGQNGDTALHWACRKDNIHVVEELLNGNHGTDIEARNQDGETSLIVTAKRYFSDVIDLLLAKGASVNAADNNGYTALHHARSADVVGLLLDHGADIDTRTILGETALEIACKEINCGSNRIVRVLLSRGASFASIDNLIARVKAAPLNNEKSEFLRILEEFSLAGNYVMK